MRIKLLLFSFFSFLSSLGQERAHNIQLFRDYLLNPAFNVSRDIDNLKKRTDFLISKNSVLSSIAVLHQYHIYTLYPCGKFLWKKDYEEASFLLELTYGYHNIRGTNILNRLFGKKKKYMRDRTIVTDSIGQLVAYGDARSLFVPVANGFNEDSEIARLFFEKKIDFAFDLFLHPNTYICLCGNNIFVLKSGKDGLVHCSWENFLDEKF